MSSKFGSVFYDELVEFHVTNSISRLLEILNCRLPSRLRYDTKPGPYAFGFVPLKPKLPRSSLVSLYAATSASICDAVSFSIPGKVCSSSWLRQKKDDMAVKLAKNADELSVNLLEKAKVPVTAHRGYVGLDMGTFVMDQSGSHKENVSRTYQGLTGIRPWRLIWEMRAGASDCNCVRASNIQH